MNMLKLKKYWRILILVLLAIVCLVYVQINSVNLINQIDLKATDIHYTRDYGSEDEAYYRLEYGQQDLLDNILDSLKALELKYLPFYSFDNLIDKYGNDLRYDKYRIRFERGSSPSFKEVTVDIYSSDDGLIRMVRMYSSEFDINQEYTLKEAQYVHVLDKLTEGLKRNE
ncbi:hypothetical protein EZV73_00075 [Acidaminobacter sp. JC074]|uniref:hypothetical protein n=1 Tax=Acidaminobacter sp. JC074 TaxID=2530199 RepID=UPI001F0F1A43|nr:hypothetical protein [Acidaminobacter sp. JC074]MCH4885934.1 hypothetical protein [Acidaminobacter sp. JC074]